ncbi:hypothetical protein MHF_1491 [Mycoplasma haemofelis Ohio2]|uniref:YqaJ viral recombinase domain-containing protein n=1 Tax=Mycoplasma haemofelis (strain Ohio2) TaxID=859194 RepID=F6FH16_MYCHI|nr:hypothetical protein MHF_1491 [Mycoplasma haemofelis Ohio2]
MFIACKDYYRKGNRIFLTKAGIERHKRIKLTGTKVPKFFKLKLIMPDEEEEFEEDEEIGEQTPFWIWSQIINFPCPRRRSPRREESYHDIESKIRKYLEKELNTTFISYTPRKYDVFDNLDSSHLQLLGGVPDGEEISESGEILSVLEIKTITNIKGKGNEESLSEIPLSYLLQISLYMYLRNVEEGYICITHLGAENWSNIDTLLLNSSLVSIPHKEDPVSGILESPISDIGDCEFEYRVTKVYTNNDGRDNRLTLFKIQVNLEKYDILIRKLCDWYSEHQYVSPEMTDKELSKLIEFNKNL